MKPMTSRARVLAALNHQETDKIPFSWGFGINPPALADLCDYLGMESVEALKARLAVADDIAQVSPRYVGPSDRRCQKNGIRTDEWGIQSKFQSFGVGGYEEQCVNPLSDALDADDVFAYRFPEADWWNFSTLPDQIEEINRSGERAIRFGNANPFEQASWMRGFENILMDTLADPEIVHALMRRATDYFLAYEERALEAAKGKIDIVFTAGDVGGQEGLLMSPEAIAEFIVPYHKEINALAHSYGAKVMYHSCGSVIRAVPLLMEAGVDVLESLQFYTAEMTPEALKDSFGDKLCFHGGVSVQKTLVEGSPEDVEQEVRHLARVLGKDGGYIMAPAHFVQAGTRPENLLAMLKAAGRMGEDGLIG